MDLFKNQGINDSSSPNDIKKVYRKLCLKHHPDKNGKTETFKLLTETYNGLLREAKILDNGQKLEANIEAMSSIINKHTWERKDYTTLFEKFMDSLDLMKQDAA